LMKTSHYKKALEQVVFIILRDNKLEN
jgi:hypothetical protein